MELGSSTDGRFILSDNPRNSLIKMLDTSNGVVLMLDSIETAKQIVEAMPSAPNTEWKEETE